MGAVVATVAVLGSTLVVLGYLLFIWWLDRYEREPFWLVLATFAYGGIFGTFFGCMLSLLPGGLATALLGPTGGGIVGTVIVAPFAEELTKGLVFLLLVLSRHFDNETDGLIYGAATGLGFACVENLVYFVGAESVEALVGMAVLRTLFTSIVHCSSSAMLGMAIGFARHRGGLGRTVGIVGLGYGLAVLNHAVWNGMATAAGFDSLGPGLGLLVFLTGGALVAGVALVMFGLTQLSLKWEHDALKRHLVAEAQRGTLPIEHADIVPYWLRRRRDGWLREGVPRSEYVAAATLLAFRLRQLEHAEGARRESILRDIADYRQKLGSWSP